MKLILVPIIMLSTIYGCGRIGDVTGRFDGQASTTLACILGGLLTALGLLVSSIIVLRHMSRRP